MSGSTNFTNSFMDATHPTHHVHSSNDPLPGAKQGANAINYSAETMECTPSTWNERTEEQFVHEHPEMMSNQNDSNSMLDTRYDQSQQGKNACTEDRPMNAQPTPDGGVAVGGEADLPEGKAGMMNKMVGKTQKVIGKATKNTELHEKGELRETGGKAAVKGEAKALHD